MTKVLSVRLNELHPPRLPNRAAEACPHQYIHEISIVGRHLRQPMVLARLRSTAVCHWFKVKRGTSVFLNGFGALLIAGFCNRNAFRLVQLCEECPSPALDRQASLIENRMSAAGIAARGQPQDRICIGMTTLTLRYQRGHFTISGPDIEMRKFKSRRDAKDWCAQHYPGSPIKEHGADAAKRAVKARRLAERG